MCAWIDEGAGVGLTQHVQRILGVDRWRVLGAQLESLAADVAQLRAEIHGLDAKVSEVDAALRGVQDYQVAMLPLVVETHARATTSDDYLTQLSVKVVEIDAALRGIQDYQVAILARVVEGHDRAIRTDDRLMALSEQMSAEREATMASNDGVRRQLTIVGELARNLGERTGAGRVVDVPDPQP